MVERIGNCRVVGEIGSGGMAVVYKAVQEPLGRIVAIKALKPSIAMDSQFAQRFEREAHFMASLQHENILHVIDFVKDGRSMYIIMEYVEGIDLYDLLEHSERLPSEVAAIIALQVARALDYAHFRGIIHRDIKPANIMISKQGEVKLMDFGIARDESLSDLTETGTGLGTPSYMSPEQILGDKLDFRSDLFSVGIVLYQMCTGQKPFVEDEARTVMQKIRLDRYVTPRKLDPSIPRQLERILGRCMEKMPANRYPTTQALIDDLMELLATRVPMNYSARLVMFLRDVGVLTDREADQLLAAGAPRNVRRATKDRTLLRHVGLVSGLLCAGLIGGGVALQASAGVFSEEAPTPQGAAALSPTRLGYLRVVADPWAEVWIDGQRVETTPLARPIPLSPGRHYVRLVNPYFQETQREVRIRMGETELLEAELEPLHVLEEGQAP
ncbi:MAG: serine/threonine protein kinase [Myxococcales bacterium]|nr:serine/threonine protein kinase [Myxococcales bacterium]